MGQKVIAREEKKKAIVVGASLSGLMTGIALAREGFEVTILERAPEERPSGAGLQVDSGQIDRTETAKFLRKIASGGLKKVEAWESIESRLRTEVVSNPNIRLLYNTLVQSVNQNNESAWVITEKGENFQGNILVGADGHRSILRRHVSPFKPDATFAGYLIWVAIVNERDIPKQYRPSLHAQKVSMPDGVGDFLLGFLVDGEDGSYNFGSRRIGWAWYDNTQNDLLRRLGCVESNVVHHSLNGSDIPTETLNELTQKALIRWEQPWLAAINHSIKTRNLIGIPIAEYVPEKLVDGRIALVGDAGHVLTPLTAKGFNSALQDAATLADCVARLGNEKIIQSLLDYEAHRLSIVRKNVISGQAFSRSFGRP